MSDNSFVNKRTPSDPEVANHLEFFVAHGAEPLADAFSVASHDEAEFVYEERRFLIAPQDEHYLRYASVLMRAKAHYVGADNNFTDLQVVVGEIPRDARTLPQVMRSKQPNSGETLAGVFNSMGSMFRSIVEKSGAAPVASTVSLKNILVLREKGGSITATVR